MREVKMETVLFGTLRPGDEFYSTRTERHLCTKLDDVYINKLTPHDDLNAYVKGNDFGHPTLAHFDGGERVEKIIEEEGEEPLSYLFLPKAPVVLA